MSRLIYYPIRQGHSPAKPRVLHISPLPPPWGGVAANLSNLLASDLIQAFDMAVLDTSRSAPREDVNPNKQIWHVDRIRRAVSLVWQTRRAIRSFKPHIVHIQAGGTDISAIRDLFLAEVALRMGRKVVFHQHFWTNSGHFRRYRSFFVPVYKIIMPRCDAKLMPTPLHIKQAANLIPVEDVCCLPNTCDPSLEEVGRARSSDLSEPCLAMYIGRLSRLKGTYDLLVAAGRLAKQGDLIRFEIAGQGATIWDDRQVMDLIEAQGIRRTLTVLGRVTDRDKVNLFSRASILVYPTLGESLPVTLIEGMAAGLPIITTSVDYLPRLVVHRENGLIVPPGEPDKLADAILELARDPDRRRQIGLANYQKYRREFSVDVVAGMLRQIYEQVLSGSSRPCG